MAARTRAFHVDLAVASIDVPAFVERLSLRFNMTVGNTAALAEYRQLASEHDVIDEHPDTSRRTRRKNGACFTRRELAALNGGPGGPGLNWTTERRFGFERCCEMSDGARAVEAAAWRKEWMLKWRHGLAPNRPRGALL